MAVSNLIWIRSRWAFHACRISSLAMLGLGFFLLTVTAVGWLPSKNTTVLGCVSIPPIQVSPAMDSRAGAILHYSETENLPRRFNLREVTMLVHRNTTHSVDRRIDFMENWVQWSAGFLYEPLSRTQDFDRLVLGGLADCSERSQILKSIAEDAGRACRFVGLNGHVVLEVHDRNRWNVADPDYGAVFPVSIKGLERKRNEGMVRNALEARGHSQATIDRYLEIIQSENDNVRLEIGASISPRLYAAELLCSALAWVLPIGLIATGIWIRTAIHR